MFSLTSWVVLIFESAFSLASATFANCSLPFEGLSPSTASNLSIITLERCDKKNALESYCYSLKNTLSDKEKGVADKISEEDKEKIEDAVKETLDWIDDNESADASEFEEKQKELEAIANPIMSQFYQNAQQGSSSSDDDDDEL